MVDCKIEGCMGKTGKKKRASFGFPGGKIEYCKVHIKEGMINIKISQIYANVV